MTMMFTGDAIKKLRENLHLAPGQFAELLQVHASSIYRWEAAGAELVRVDPFQVRLIVLLQQQVKLRKTAEAKADLAGTIVTGLLVGGGLFALYKLLDAAFGEKDDD